MTTQRVRPERGKHNITYRNGTFRLSKSTAAAAGFPARVGIMRNRRTGEVLLYPADESDLDSHKLTAAGQASWGNSFTSFALARALGLPLKKETVSLCTTWDPDLQALHFRYQRPERGV